MPAVTDVLLVGARGFGAVHLYRLEQLAGRVRLIGLCDPHEGPDSGFGSDTACWPTLQAALDSGIRPDVVIIATPTGTHFDLAVTALEHGADLYLEKPPVATMAQFTELLALQRRTGRAIQIGFQSFGSHALAEIAALGAPTSVATWASWTRDAAYWSRSSWAGRRIMGDTAIVDGVLTNPLSHAIATALRIAGARRREHVAQIELELYRANDIEADDTSSARITLTDGTVVSAALTLAGIGQSEPLIEVRTPLADLTFAYTEDRLTHSDGRVSTTERTDLFEELLDHRDSGGALSSPLVDSGAFMTVLESVRTAADPVPIDPSLITVRGDGPSPRRVIADIEHWVERTARSRALFSELDAPFSARAGSGAQHPLTLTAGGSPIAVRDDGSAITATSGPRPFLHPVRTPSGVVVTDAHPADHDWHLGVSFAVQDVNGVNCWGGPTYTAEHGYRWLEDHGRIETSAFDPTDDGFTSSANWLDPDGDTLLVEHTHWYFLSASDPRAWLFETTTTLEAASGPVTLGSPGTHGRTGGGYGGLAWRFPAATSVDVRTPDATGEDAVHGTVSAWLAFSAHFPGGEATVAIAAADDRTREDPWFVRVAGYPGIGTALAWEEPLRLDAGSAATRSFRGLVADGRLTDAEVARLLG